MKKRFTLPLISLLIFPGCESIEELGDLVCENFSISSEIRTNSNMVAPAGNSIHDLNRALWASSEIESSYLTRFSLPNERLEDEISFDFTSQESYDRFKDLELANVCYYPYSSKTRNFKGDLLSSYEGYLLKSIDEFDYSNYNFYFN